LCFSVALPDATGAVPVLAGGDGVVVSGQPVRQSAETAAEMSADLFVFIGILRGEVTVSGPERVKT
jgi:hypothetical protein